MHAIRSKDSLRCQTARIVGVYSAPGVPGANLGPLSRTNPTGARRSGETYSVSMNACVLATCDARCCYVGRPRTSHGFKKADNSSIALQSKAQLQDYHSFHLLFTMMFPKTLVSVLAVLAVAGSAAGAAAPSPVRRGDGGYPPPSNLTIPASQCNTRPVQCYNTYTSNQNPVVGLLANLLNLIVDPNLGVGLTCSSILGGAGCSASPVCCNNINQSGLINLGCVPVNLNL
ncbi:hypothetical protein BC834DRAFT_885313 [Gloeopeniophorella convolvens]|nr:hypothetical protein BC834DRAFT_885313 [Gloeopeniophorella convolvens]